MTNQLDVERSSIQLFNFLKASVSEMEAVCYSTGKSGLSEISRSDLCTLDPFLSRAIGVELGYISSEEQNEFFRGFSKLPDRVVLKATFLIQIYNKLKQKTRF